MALEQGSRIRADHDLTEDNGVSVKAISARRIKLGDLDARKKIGFFRKVLIDLTVVSDS